MQFLIRLSQTYTDAIKDHSQHLQRKWFTSNSGVNIHWQFSNNKPQNIRVIFIRLLEVHVHAYELGINVCMRMFCMCVGERMQVSMCAYTNMCVCVCVCICVCVSMRACVYYEYISRHRALVS